MKIHVNGVIWMKTILKEHTPQPILQNWGVLLFILFITLVVLYFTYSIFSSIKAKSSSSKGQNSSKYSCPEIDKQHIIYPYVVATTQNVRPYQEDRYCTVGRFNGNDDVSFYAVFDGHGGSKCSQFCASNLHSSIAKSINTSPYKQDQSKKTRSNSNHRGDRKSGFLREMDIVNGFQLCDARYRGTASKMDDGTTAVAVFISKSRKQLITAHVGDSRAIMITENDSYDLTADHKPSNPSEKERVELLGGRIIQYGVLRVQGILAVTRALGDYSLRPFVSNVPVVNYYELRGKEDFVVIASDGLWDVMNHQDVASLLHTYLLQNHSLQECTQYLIDLAIMKQSTDNITVMIIDLRSPQATFGTSSSVKWNEIVKKETINSLEEEDPQTLIDEFLQDSIDILEQNIYS